MATYDPAFRRVYAVVSPSVVDRLLDLLDSGQVKHERAYLGHDGAAAVIPAPQTRMADAGVDATLGAAAIGWVDMEAARPRIERWLPHAAGCPRCADALVGSSALYPLPVKRTRDSGMCGAWSKGTLKASIGDRICARRG